MDDNTAVQKYKQAVKMQLAKAQQVYGKDVPLQVLASLPYSDTNPTDVGLNLRRFNDIKLNKRNIQRLRKLMDTDVAVSQIQRSVHPLVNDMYNNAFYVGLAPELADELKAEDVKKHLQYPYYFKDYKEWDAQTDQQLLDKGTVVLGGRTGLGTLAHELGHAKDRQQNPQQFFAQHRELGKARNAQAKSLGIGLGVGAGVGLAGSLALILGGMATNEQWMFAAAAMPLVVGSGLGAAVGIAAGAAKSQNHYRTAHKLRQQKELRASQYAVEALKKMRIKPDKLKDIKQNLNLALKTYGVKQKV